MDTKLAKVLVQRGVIRQGTILEAYQSAKGLSCVYDAYAFIRYVVIGAKASAGYVYFEVASSPTERHSIRSDYVAGIDGMAIKRVAAAHQLQEDGEPIRSPVRRERKRGRLALPHFPVEPVPSMSVDHDAGGNRLGHEQA
jgi:hypothetical protein